MCGIFAYIGNKKQAGDIVFQGLKQLEYRGYDSWGIALKPEGAKTLKVKKNIGKISKAKIILPPSTIAIGHTRWATHGKVTNKNAHPHLDCTKKIAVIHNGIVENYRSLKVKLKREKHIFHSETDTEVIAHFIEENKKNNSIKKAVFSCFKSIIGSNAIVALDLDNQVIIACRDGSPLVVGMGNNEYFLASDVTPFLKFTKKAVFIKDQEGVILSKNGVELFDIKTNKKKTLKIQIINWKSQDVQKKGYAHFLLKEIMEQKNTIPNAAKINKNKIENIAGKIKRGFKVILVGCGTAYYCALLGKYFFAKVGIQAEAYGAYEFLPYAKFCDKKTVLIAISQSGETADTLIAVKAAKEKGAKIAAIVNTLNSSLERLAYCVLPINAGPEIAVVSTKAFTAQLTILYLLANTTNNTYYLAQKQIKKIKGILNNWLKYEIQNKVMKLAKTIMQSQDIYIIGKHLNYPAALEFALKIKETSYIHSEAFASGELKHGVISLIQKGTPCIVLADNDSEIKREILSSATEIKTRGGRIIGISPFCAQEFDDLIKTPDLGELTFVGNIIVGQLLGYYLGVGRGTDPDKPRNLAKSVTVK